MFAVALAATRVGTVGADAADRSFEMPGVALAAFFGHAVPMRAEVLVPDGYDAHPERTYPAVYVVPAFGAAFRPTFAQTQVWRAAMTAARTPFVVVFLDASYPAGHNEFADSANDGPWATALTAEFLPQIERRFRLEPRAEGRFLVGHSSGGWSALWLQIAFPDTFGGVWSIAPDPVDFHDFTGVDLTATPAPNFYRGPAGEWPFVRVAGRDTSTLRAYAIREERRGAGGQFASFEAVFSPRGADGKPVPLFDRRTGDVDPAVAAYWEAHWDIARVLTERWPRIGPSLAGKLNVFVGTQDTFHLEGPVARLQRRLAELGSDARVTFAPDCDHWTILDWDGGLIARIAREIAATRVASDWRRRDATAILHAP